MTLREAALTLISPSVLWALITVLFGAQVLLIHYISVWINSVFDDKELFNLLPAAGAISTAFYYDRYLLAPILANILSDSKSPSSASVEFLVLISIFSALLVTANIHFARRPDKWTRKSMLVFAGPIRRRYPAEVARAWVRISGINNFAAACLGSSFIIFFGAVSGIDADQTPVKPLFVAGGLSLMAAIVTLTRRAIWSYPSRANLIGKLNYVLRINGRDDRQRFTPRSQQSDPLGWGRKEIVECARILERSARRYDVALSLPTQHPVAAVYRAVASEIRRYCTSAESVAPRLSFRVAAIMLCIEMSLLSDDPRWQRYIAGRLDVFDENGIPRALAATAVPSGASRIAGGAAILFARVNNTFQTSWKLVVFLTAMVLFAFGRIDFDAVVGVLK